MWYLTFTAKILEENTLPTSDSDPMIIESFEQGNILLYTDSQEEAMHQAKWICRSVLRDLKFLQNYIEIFDMECGVEFNDLALKSDEGTKIFLSWVVESIPMEL